MQHTTQTDKTASLSLLSPLSFCYLFIATLFLLLALSACGSNNEPAQQEPISMRTPRPTFTPTSPSNNNAAAQQPPAPEQPANNESSVITNDSAGNTAAGDSDGAESAAGDTAGSTNSAGSSSERIEVESGGIAEIGIQLLNGRAGPSAESELVGIVGAGEYFDIIGRNDVGDWWEVCCYQDTPFWVADEFVNIRNNQ